jgi:phosphoglycolate phosphatase-like HAD superfamily hydrolase
MSVEALKNFQPTKDFFVGIDSDGCAFDTMEIKHKECFIPNIVNYWDLQAVSKMARETAEFVNLYGKWRGINRFPALVMVLELLAERPEATERGYKLPDIEPLRAWIKQETRLGNPALAEKVKACGDGVLKRALDWSAAVNADVAKIVRGVPPFPHVRESIQKLFPVADIVVVSATPGEALQREWEEHDLARYAGLICGQEMGTKAEHIKYAADGKYKSQNILMVGDANGDLKAARTNQVLFYPINPGDEPQSWKNFLDKDADLFLSGRYAGAREEKLISEFGAHLPEKPPWKTR